MRSRLRSLPDQGILRWLVCSLFALPRQSLPRSYRAMTLFCLMRGKLMPRTIDADWKIQSRAASRAGSVQACEEVGNGFDGMIER